MTNETKEVLVDITLLLLRIAVAVIFIQVGGMKLFGWFGGLPPGGEGIMTTIAGILEVAGGIFVLLGLFTRPVAFILSGEMAVAYFIGHFPMGFWPIQNNGGLAVIMCFVFLFYAAYGAGRFSLDSVIRSKKTSTSFY